MNSSTLRAPLLAAAAAVAGAGLAVAVTYAATQHRTENVNWSFTAQPPASTQQLGQAAHSRPLHVDGNRVRAWREIADALAANVRGLSTNDVTRLVDCSGRLTGGHLASPAEISNQYQGLTPRQRDLALAAWVLCD